MMKRYVMFTILFAMLFLTSGCGHNMTTNSKGIGIDVSWNGDGYIPNLRLGYWDVAQTTVRGNTSYTSNTSTGGSILGSGGTTQTIQFNTGSQFNQGNVKDVLMSQHVDPKTKRQIASRVFEKTHKADPTMTKTVNTAGGTGKKPPQVKQVTTGTDRIVDTAGDVAKNATPYVADTVKTTAPVVKDGVVQVSKNAKDAVVETTQNIQNATNGAVNGLKGIVMWIIIGVVALVVILIAAAIVILRIKKKSLERNSGLGIVKDVIAGKLKQKACESGYSPYQFFSISNGTDSEKTTFIYNK